MRRPSCMYVNTECRRCSFQKRHFPPDYIDSVAERMFNIKAWPRGLLSRVNNAEHFPTQDLTTNSSKSLPGYSRRRVAVQLCLCNSESNVGGNSIFAVWQTVFPHQRNACLSENEWLIHNVTPLLTKKALKGFFFFFLFLFLARVAKMIQHIHATNHKLQLRTCFSYFAALH